MKKFLAVFLLAVSSAYAQTSYWLDSSPFIDTIGAGQKGQIDYVLTSNASSGSTGYGHIGYQMNPGSALRFSTNSPSIGLFLRQSSQTFAIYQDGIQIGGTITMSAGFTDARITLMTGLDTSVTHDYLILQTNLAILAPGGNNYVWDIELSGNGVAAVEHDLLIVEYEYGDSRTYQQGLIVQGLLDCRLGHCYNTGLAALDYEGWNTGGSGQQVYTYFESNTSLIPAGANRVWCPAGINDFSNNVSSANFQAAYQTMLVNIRTQIGGGKTILCLQPLCTPNFVQASLNTWGTYIQAAITATGDSLAIYVPTSGWITQTSAYSADGTHLTALGEAQYANRQIPIAAAHAISFSGPNAGFNGSASTPYTVVLATRATFTGDQTLTFDDGSKGGTFTPSVGSPGTSTVTVTPTAGTNFFTFTYTPAASGTIMITPTSGQTAWTMPNHISFVSKTVNPSMTATAASVGSIQP